MITSAIDHLQKQPYQIMVKPAGARCNLECKYCYYLEKDNLYPEVKMPRLSEEVLESFIQRYIQSQPGNRVTFSWQGGEPTLLGIDYFKKVVQWQKKYASGKVIDNAFQTNGILLDDDWCALFKEGNFLIGISIDGPEDLHDAYRINKRGGGSFKQVIRGLEVLKKHQINFNTLTVLHRENADDPLRTYNFLKQIGSQYLQFIPIVERECIDNTEESLSLVSPAFEGDAKVTDWSLTAAQYGNFLTMVFDEWVRKDVSRVSVQLFESTLSYWFGCEAAICVFRETCGQGMAMEHNGDLYSCDHYVYPDYRLGNIMDTDLDDLAYSEVQNKFGSDKADTLPKQCLDCSVRSACHGGCPKHRINITNDGEAGLNYFCEGYHQFFTLTAPYMRFMAEALKHNRPAADVMVWCKEKDADFLAFNIGRNDPCPCFSGKKFKKCCGQ